jgi:hypothetical protein
LIGVDRKWQARGQNGAFDPQQNSLSGCLFFGTAHERSIPTQCSWQGELKVGAARQAANSIVPRQKSNSLLDISNPSKRRSTDQEIVAPSFWEYG